MEFSSPEEALNKVWGYTSFRPLQQDIISNSLQGNDTLAILPTGGGKSLCFQIPALCLPGLCLVITPIIALMKDQVEQLQKLGIRAQPVYSGMSNREIDIILDNCVYGKVKFLYVSPERLKSDLFIERAKKMQIGLLAIDEAHCISQWGYDFRPSYLQIDDFKKYIPDTRIIALTATATRPVISDIVEQLHLGTGHKVYIQSFARPNLSFIIRKTEDKDNKLLEVASRISGPAIVYVRTRKRTKQITELLVKNGITADFYHGGLDPMQRSQKQENWMKNKFRFMVATNAFGMGINKPDVRLVVHLDLPDNIEAYYQEAGRAGRDGARAYATILYHESDKGSLRERVRLASPEPEFIKRIYQSLANFYKIAVGSSLFTSYDFDISEFAKVYGLDYLQTFHALKKLEDQGFIQLTDSFYHPSKVMIRMEHMEFYKFQIANKSMEPLLKALLRLYGGELYTNFMTVSERKLAISLKTSQPEIERKLDILDKQDVIVYDRRKDMPQITFTTPRYDASRLPLDVKFLEKRRTGEMDKAEAIIEYISGDNICRAVFIRNYFGETTAGDCGTCDVCLQKNKKPVTGKNEREIRKTILLQLRDSPADINSLIVRVNQFDENAVLTVLQSLLDQESVYYDERGFLHCISTVNP